MAFIFERDLKPGNTIRLHFGKKNPNNSLLHIRAIVDDTQIVYRAWSYRRRHWVYAVANISLFALYNS